jgi:hypothetical protein
MNIDKDFTIKLTPDYDGGDCYVNLFKTQLGNRKECIHGYNDYFFHAHVAEKFNENNFDFMLLIFRNMADLY